VARLVGFILIVMLALSACSGGNTVDVTPENPQASLEQAIEAVRNTQTFSLLITQEGAEYPFYISLDEGVTTVGATMRRGEAQFITPDIMVATVNLEIPPLPAVGVELFAQSSNQWFRLAGGNWINFPIAEGFDPGELVKVDGGFSQALGQLREVIFVGMEDLIDGTRTQHIRGIANGDVVNDLLFNLLSIESDNVIVDVYINPSTGMPAQISVTLPETATEAEPNDTRWNIEIYDVNEPATYTVDDNGAPVEVQNS
jgi:hypothetical protein